MINILLALIIVGAVIIYSLTLKVEHKIIKLIKQNKELEKLLAKKG